MAEPLAPGPTGREAAVVDFVERVTGRREFRREERVAVFDNDGTLWCEKPMPIQADFILRRLHEMAEADPELRDRQPWKAAYEQDYGWLGGGDGRALRRRRHERDARSSAASSPRTRGSGSTTSSEQADAFLRSAQHPTLGRGYLACAYEPMVELLRYLEANGFSNYIASGGGRDFMMRRDCTPWRRWRHGCGKRAVKCWSAARAGSRETC